MKSVGVPKNAKLSTLTPIVQALMRASDELKAIMVPLAVTWRTAVAPMAKEYCKDSVS